MGFSCYSDSSVCKDCGVIWFLRILDGIREMKSYECRFKNIYRELGGFYDSFEGMFYFL